MTPLEREWLLAVKRECKRLRVQLRHLEPSKGDFWKLKELYEEHGIPVTDFTWEVKNLISSLAVTDPEVLKGRHLLTNAAIQRLTATWEYIKERMKELNNAA